MAVLDGVAMEILLAGGIAVRHRFARGCPSTADNKGKGRVDTPLHFQYIAHRGACGKTRVVPQNGRPRPESTEMGVVECVLRSELMT
jgi:hypothetical protein